MQQRMSLTCNVLPALQLLASHCYVVSLTWSVVCDGCASVTSQLANDKPMTRSVYSESCSILMWLISIRLDTADLPSAQ